jgi:hypothetical protein
MVQAKVNNLIAGNFRCLDAVQIITSISFVFCEINMRVKSIYLLAG